MSSFSSLIALSLPALIVSILGTIITVLCFWYRQTIKDKYFALKTAWHRKRNSIPQWGRLVLKTFIGVIGSGFILVGFVLMPLPGPGAVIVMTGAGLLDLEFNWIVPSLIAFFKLFPDGWIPEKLNQGLDELKNYRYPEYGEPDTQ